MPFPEIPSDLFDEFDWGQFHTLVVVRQIELVNNLSDETLDELGRLVNGYVATAARNRRVLQIVHTLLTLGLKVVLA